MSDWRSIVSEYYERHLADQGPLVLGQPATVGDLDLLNKKTGFRMPPEFRSFYSEFNGFGIDRDGETEWFFVHTSEIPNLTADTRSWIEETHPEVAKRYVAVVNWWNGDSSGYLFAESGEPLDGFFMFEHESYEFEPEQDWREFLTTVDSSLRDFFTE